MCWNCLSAVQGGGLPLPGAARTVTLVCFFIRRAQAIKKKHPASLEMSYWGIMRSSTPDNTFWSIHGPKFNSILSWIFFTNQIFRNGRRKWGTPEISTCSFLTRMAHHAAIHIHFVHVPTALFDSFSPFCPSIYSTFLHFSIISITYLQYFLPLFTKF